MAADLSKIANSLERETFSAKLDRMRDHIAQELRAKGSFTIQEGGRTFKLKLVPPGQASEEPEAKRK